MSLLYTVCFDIENDTLRRKVGNILLEYGERVQYSVFEIKLDNDSQFMALKTQLQALVTQFDGDWDIRFYHLNTSTLKRSMNLQGEAIAQFPSAYIF
ncbi:CRISPR-associated endonuclease Cas2 [Pseudoalteromonas sp. T1lg65]|uniref:CRISPR-associated endonuclease Cas2 n=1 Tax=Pseudoalteromonas sp. T1lg65 TaxID=2077101 RepID=UPI003F7ADF8F